MNKILKYALIPLAFLMVSCGTKAPNVGSSDVEDLVTEMLVAEFFPDSSKNEGFEIELVEIIKVDVDNEAQRTKFTFKYKVQKSAESEPVVSHHRYKAIASYSEDGELFVELFSEYNEPNW